MKHKRVKRDSWDDARKYTEWALMQGFSKETLLLIPHWGRFRLTRQERRVIRGLILNHFRNQEKTRVA